ncbi:filamentous hemagglutinin N-terminal domain-containing protein [Sphingomonas sp. QA11]|uniref:beta strand repeat-containing protein n=1 Tax=Sphingomonas sp. QA11 TaxID=2950605 RepID=UPI00234A7F89|nr:GLUG motif-containing protein [Sphingomonas sp. QA11]WCM28764.1 filamentous hemagglutinin N-terminal domain-containing protein [Sphingomonas sp. QA11]
MNRMLPLALLTSTALIPATAIAQELPTGGQLQAGAATIANPSAGTMQITQTSDRAIINWQSFSVGAGGRVDISQPGATSALLNRVTGNTTSEIAGQITANGRVFLVNPNGILITATGSVRAAGFTASTLDIADRDFMAGSDELTVTAPRAGQEVRYIRGGFAGAMRGDARGLVQARLRSLGASGEQAVDLGGDGFLQVKVPSAGVTVAGRITADNIVLTAGSARDMARGVVNVSGVLDATSISSHGGTISLTGATVKLTGATLDASGATGGGAIRIGGDWQGSGTLAHATQLEVDAASVIRSDATRAGDGGRIVLWSDERTQFAGTINARGVGDSAGGEAEVSSKGLLGFGGAVDLFGARSGTLLLDPYNVTIVAGSGGALSSGTYTPGANDSQIGVTTITNVLAAGTNVTITTGSSGSQAGNITVSSAISWSGNAGLTLTAANNIVVNAAITATGTANANKKVTLNAGNDISTSATISSVANGTGNVISLNAGRDITVGGAMTANAGTGTTINLTAGRNIGITSTISATSTSGGTVTLTAGNDTYTGATVSESGSGTISANRLRLTSGATAQADKAAFTLNGANNSIVTLAGSVGSLSYTGRRQLIVGTVTTAGLTANGAISLTTTNSSGIQFNSAVATSGTLTLNSTAPLVTGAGGSVNVGKFVLAAGDWQQVAAVLPAFSAGDFQVAASGASFLRATGGNGSAATPYLLADVYGLQGIGTGGYFASFNYALAGNIDASGTAGWNGGAGFVPIGGGTSSNIFQSGVFDGRGFTIAGLTINLPGVNSVGLFGASGTVIKNVNLTGADITGAYGVGILVGSADGSATILNSSVAGAVHGTLNNNSQLGGLVGSNGGLIDGSSANVTIDTATAYSSGGLVGSNAGSITNSHAAGTVYGAQWVGGLAGYNSGTIDTSYASANVVGSPDGAAGNSSNIGGLAGLNDGAISRSYATGDVVGGTAVGGLVGTNGASYAATITSSYARGNVTGSQQVGGLVGSNGKMSYVWNGSGVTPVTVAGSITGSNYGGGTVTGDFLAGGLVGENFAGSITQSFNSGTVVGGQFTGGLIGRNDAGATASGVYSTGTVTGSAYGVGGLVGENYGSIGDAYSTGAVGGTAGCYCYTGGLVGLNSGTLQNVYATGAVSVGVVVGGLIGSQSDGNVSNAYWDSYSTGQGSAFGSTTSGSVTNILSVTSDPTQSGAANYAYKAGAYANLAAAAGIGTATPTGFVFLAGNSTRPFLAFEVPTSFTTTTDAGGRLLISNSHQLQLIGYDQARLSGSYSLAGNIDLTDTGAVVAGTPDSYSGMWAGTGFVPIGTDGLGNVWNGTSHVLLANVTSGIYGFTGTLNGNGFTLSNLRINRSTLKNVGLFGLSSGTLSNLNVSGSVNGLNGVGGLVGILYNGGSVSGSNSAVNVTGNNLVGGLVGNQSDGSSITRSGASGTVSGVSNVGGLVGYASGATITRSFATGTVAGTNYVGGLVGYQYNSTTANSYATGQVGASTNTAGGMIGYLYGGSLANSYSTGLVIGTRNVGGLIGQKANGATVTSSYWNVLTSGQATSAGGAGLTTTQMQAPLSYAGWDFVTIWNTPNASASPALRP